MGSARRLYTACNHMAFSVRPPIFAGDLPQRRLNIADLALFYSGSIDTADYLTHGFTNPRAMLAV